MTDDVTQAIVAAIVDDPVAIKRLAEALAPYLAPTAKPAPEEYGPRTAGERVGLHERTIRRAIAAGTLPAHTVAGRWRIEAADLDAWVASGAPTSMMAAHTAWRPQWSARPSAGADAIAGIIAGSRTKSTHPPQ